MSVLRANWPLMTATQFTFGNIYSHSSTPRQYHMRFYVLLPGKACLPKNKNKVIFGAIFLQQFRQLTTSMPSPVKRVRF